MYCNFRASYVFIYQKSEIRFTQISLIFADLNPQSAIRNPQSNSRRFRWFSQILIHSQKSTVSELLKNVK